MNDTLEHTDTDVLASNDFAPKCSLIRQVTRKKVDINVSECENEAVWVGFLPCCGRSALVCEEHRWHRVRPFRCKQCRINHPDLINWAKL